MKISFFEIESWEKNSLQESFKANDLLFSRFPLNKKSIAKAKDTEVLSIFIYSKITKDILDSMPKLKVIATRSTGFDHIDIDECKKRGIAVCNVPTYGENTVAEHTFALILAISRKIPESIINTRAGDFRLNGLRGFDLKGKTIGIIGCGNIGKNVARIAKGFQMDVLVFDVNKDPKLSKEMGFSYAELPELFKKSDIITLHVPDNKHTHHMIGKDAFRQMKQGVVIVNTARGGLINSTELIKALNSGIVSYAGIDVLEGECSIKEEKELLNELEFGKNCDLKNVLQDHILLNKKNVLITPHNAFNSNEALQRILDTTIENIKAFLKEKPVNKII